MNEQALAYLVGKKVDAVMPVPELGLLTIFLDGGLTITVKVMDGGLSWEIEQGSEH